MTNKEAIAVLESDAEYLYSQDSPYCREAYQMAIEALKVEPQRAYEQGVKDTLDKYDETCRIASDIRCAMGCKTSKECRDLISNGVIQRVKRGRWEKKGISIKGVEKEFCSECKTWSYGRSKAFCPNCGARMIDEEEE